MNCPHCQKELPENFGGKWCPFCEEWFFSKDAPAPITPAPDLQPLPPAIQFQFSWQSFLWALLLPPSLTQVAALILGHLTGPQSEGAGALCGIVGSVGGAIGGIICGIMIAVRVGTTLPARVVLSLFFSGIMIVVCLALCCFGCAVGYGGSKL